jgi:hypothetical protein
MQLVHLFLADMTRNTLVLLAPTTLVGTAQAQSS